MKDLKFFCQSPPWYISLIASLKNKCRTAFLFSSLVTFFFSGICPSFGQAELAPWGNMTGIRIDGQLMEFGTAVAVVGKHESRIKVTAKERQRPVYTRDGSTQIVHTRIDSLDILEKVTDLKKGKARLTIQVSARANMPLQGVYLVLTLPENYGGSANMRLIHSRPIELSRDTATLNKYLEKAGGPIHFISSSSRLTLTPATPVQMTIRKGSGATAGTIHVFIPLERGEMQNGRQVTFACEIGVSGAIDKKDVVIALDTAAPGSVFDGIGGNFRLQNPREDPQVINYCLQNLRVAWGRVEMPWALWQPVMEEDPIAAAKNGRLNPHVKAAMEMAKRLSEKGIPIIVSAWFPPGWAVVGQLHRNPNHDGVWGNPLDSTRTQAIYQSIADYLVYLKDVYSVEVEDFSFNESDLGINVRQTSAEQDALIKGLGAYFVSRGLKTKLLLGDNSDATTYQFIDLALHDTAAYPYIGAVSFHSWRGWDTPTLQKWARAASLIKKPLIVAEGSIDAQAWGYPAIFEEPSYALKEISLYIRLLAICEPASILQWQFTSDYSLLAGGGIYGNNAPLHPTQRFWNLKQLASTPEGLKAMHLQVDGPEVTGAALGDQARGKYVIHLVNNGPTRKVIVKGLPGKVSSLDRWITNQDRAMQEEKPVQVKGGTARFTLDATSFVTLVSQ